MLAPVESLLNYLRQNREDRKMLTPTENYIESGGESQEPDVNNFERGLGQSGHSRVDISNCNNGLSLGDLISCSYGEKQVNQTWEIMNKVKNIQ